MAAGTSANPVAAVWQLLDGDGGGGREVEQVAEVARLQVVVLVQRRHAATLLGDDARAELPVAHDDYELLLGRREHPPAALLDEQAARLRVLAGELAGESG